jgi:predicted MPP superfamily phosphohydrolase
MLRIRYLSDLHLEFIKDHKIKNFINKIVPNKEEICILAGDIGNPYKESYNSLMQYLNNGFKRTFIITGNHEYYNNDKTIIETNEYLTSYFTKYPNIRFLNNSYELYEGHYFVGTTLWSKIINPEYEINDTVCIKGLNVEQYNNMNCKSTAFLYNFMEAHSESNNVIIITHHMPSEKLINPKYKIKGHDNYNQWFYCDMDEFIKQHSFKIKCWIYGHTHIASNIRICDIPFLCNPIGYPNENSKPKFDEYFDISH